MPENNHSNAPLPPPHVQLIQMAMAHWVSRIAYVAAKLGLADHLASGPKTADDLAGPTGTHAPSLYRLMRALTNLNILTEDASHRFALTPLGEALKTGAPGSARPSILTLASDWMSRGWEQLLYSVQTGGCGFEQSLGMPLFDWLARHPEDASLFSETMMGFHGAEPAAVAAAYDFSGLSTLIDVGGATGPLLATILAGNPASRGILYDLPHVVRDAPALIQARGLADRVTIEAGPKGKKVAAVAPDWPGLSRGAKTEQEAVERLLAYVQRYAPVAKLAGLEGAFPKKAVADVVERELTALLTSVPLIVAAGFLALAALPPSRRACAPSPIGHSRAPPRHAGSNRWSAHRPCPSCRWNSP